MSGEDGGSCRWLGQWRVAGRGQRTEDWLAVQLDKLGAAAVELFELVEADHERPRCAVLVLG